MPRGTFVSWSGSNAKTIAFALKEAMASALPALDIGMRSPEDRDGRVWYDELVKTLNNAAVGILVLTPECRNSWWLPWEIGMLSAEPVVPDQQGRHVSTIPRHTKIYAICFGMKDVDRLGPVRVNHWEFSRENFANLLKALLEDESQDVKWQYEPTHPEFDEKVWLPLKAKIDPLVSDLAVFERQEKWIAKLRERLRSNSARKSEQDLREIIDILAKTAISDPALFEALGHLVEATESQIRSTSASPWVELEANMAIGNIKRARNRVSEISRGSADVSIERHADFFIDEILGRVRDSMWATNVGLYEGSSRVPNAAMLRAHAEIRKRNKNATIQRVFVVDTEPSESVGATRDYSNLSDVMRRQEAHGVETWAIRKNVFGAIFQAHPEEFVTIGGADFNILDDSRVYVTNLTKDEITVNFIRLLRGHSVIDHAKTLRDRIMAKSVKIENGYLDDFLKAEEE